MSVLLQISDAHFGTERAPVVEALVEFARELAPDLVIVSGDITQRAQPDQFERAARFVERLAAPHVLAIPGNHDIPLFDVATRLVDPYREYRRAFGAQLEPRFETSDCLVLTVKTTRRYRHVDGEISAAQRDRVATELRGARRSQLRVVVTHQPLAVPRASEVHNVARGADRAVRAWAEAGADLLLAGHIHLPFILPLHEATTLPRPLWAVNAGTAVSSRTRRDAGNSVNVIRVDAASNDAALSCQVEHWALDASAPSFTRRTELRLRVGS
jgi:3',5'-cyclic AMP phosphodiesterase CpdA